jgi:hypothetical protein
MVDILHRVAEQNRIRKRIRTGNKHDRVGSLDFLIPIKQKLWLFLIFSIKMQCYWTHQWSGNAAEKRETKKELVLRTLLKDRELRLHRIEYFHMVVSLCEFSRDELSDPGAKATAANGSQDHEDVQRKIFAC